MTKDTEETRYVHLLRLANWRERLENSTYLRQCISRDGQLFERHLQDIDGAIRSLLAPDPCWADASSRELAKILRCRKRELVLLLASLDYGEIIRPVPNVMKLVGYLSDFAALAVDVGLLSLMKEAGFADHRGICVLGMGKLGGSELNYSSDIDLIVLFDAEYLVAQIGDDAYRKVQRVVRHLVSFLETPDKEGYIFRTDLRLRPDPSSTPPAVEINAAVNYYESMGRAWERAAMLKARALAGDRQLARHFFQRIRPFIWRRHLDYASVDDIRAIRARAIQQHNLENLDGVNVKLIEGGIREIELFAQIFQLIWGGRKKSLQVIPTLEALKALVAEEIIVPQVEQTLASAYRYFRRLEHAAQLLDDHQRHDLPRSAEEWQRFARLMNISPDEIKAQFLMHVREVRKICVPEADEEQTGTMDESPETEQLRVMGYQDPEAVRTITERWLGGSYRLTSTERARTLLEKLLPRLLRAFASTVAPDDALGRMDKFMMALPAGVQLFSLFLATPELLHHCADIMGNAPRLAKLLQHKPSLFDYLLQHADASLPVLPLPVSGLEETLDECRRLVQEVEFRTSVGFMAGKITSAELYQHLSQTAELVIGQTLRTLRAESSKLPQNHFAILALGKLGKQQLMPDSDLDLVFVYRPEGDEGGVGYVRLAQRLIGGLSVATSEGTLYEVDLRLRPHGESGTICTQFASLQSYFADEAWLWEHYAFSQARLIYADYSLEEDLCLWLDDLQTRSHHCEPLQQAIREMRPKISTAHPAQGLWDVKYHKGGIMDWNFCQQFLQMMLAHDNPHLVRAEAKDLLLAGAEAGLVDAADVADLHEAGALLAEVQTAMRVSGGSPNMRTDDAPPGQQRLLCRLANCDDVATLEECLQESYATVSRQFAQFFGIEAV